MARTCVEREADFLVFCGDLIGRARTMSLGAGALPPGP